MFSVVIPLYNKVHTIIRTLDSVLNQTYTKFEVVVVNDGSTDNSISEIRSFTNDPRVRVIEQTNQGVSAARNKGVVSAKYDYIAFLDGDDEWLPEYLATINKAIEQNPQCGMICCAGLQRSYKTNKTSIRLAKKYDGEIRVINYFENPHVFTHTSATVVTKESFNKVNGFPVSMKKNEDFTFFFSVALVATTVYCGFPLSCYYGDVEGQATKINQIDTLNSEINVCERFNITFKLWDELERTNRLFKVFLKYELRHIFISALRKKNYKLIALYMENLDAGILDLFPTWEFFLYQKPTFLKLNILYILATKVIWRMKAYPRVA